MVRAISRGFLLAVFSLVMVGCGGRDPIPPLAEVQGTLTDSTGNPLDGVRIMFLPDPEKEVFGSPGIGETDSNGKFVIFYNGDKTNPGTAVGRNRVILEDIRSIRSSRDEVPIGRRFHRKYLAAKTTDLAFDVKDEEGQTIDVTVDLPEDQ